MKLITKEIDKNNVLTTVLKEVTNFSKAVKNLDKMVDIMINNNGIGLTANQVGLLDRMFIFTLNDGTIEYAINPEVLIKFSGLKSDYEGCLSYPDNRIKVRRPKRIKVKYHNGSEYIERELKGLEARIFLHEFDHCEGQCILGR